MDINKVYRDLSELSKEQLNGRVSLYLIRYRSEEPLVYKPEIQEEVQWELAQIFLDYFKADKTRNKDQEAYDFVVNNNDVYHLMKKDRYNEILNMCNNFNDGGGITDLSNIVMNQIFAYGVKIRLEKYELMFFGAFSIISKIKKGKFLGNLNNNELKAIKRDETLGFDGNVKVMYVGDEILTTSTSFFEKLFDLSKLYKGECKNVLDTISTYKVIDNFDELKEHAVNDARIAKRLTKLNADPARVQAFFSNVNRVEKVLKSQALQEKFEGIEYKEDRLVYKGEHKDKFITLIMDAAYTSIVGQQERVDRGF
ncbi:Kiwa anti-phage protein KwaB-like domain-containing protein [Listeria booriae]|uniref:DUF4868 domain-containing protein n=1 Tax=Listeria booriae TaxID=1552123 RepID=A0A7X0XAT4_9LIST|nr:Kiwa anti-phage protein KwaB-like domain-containing protein [Listeria booriae]MBC1490657.1 DUF4868 domain-containing protein [Listeria booriae]MBC1503807.1 DUF4868 domain-containing protein [Listeria booriae]MBC1524758.1 DUF4868 domain-containing protein [Listeria booriae]